MAIQLHSYLSPKDDVGEEIIDKAIWKLKAPRIKQIGYAWVAEPLGDFYKSRAKYRAGKEPEERDVNILDRFTLQPENGSIAIHATVAITMGNSVKDFQRQIEEAALALILAKPEQAGSIIVND